MKRFYTGFAVAAVVAALAVPLAFAHRERMDRRHLRTVREGVLYRSGQLPTTGIARLVHDLGIRTVVSLRDSDRPADQAEEKFCGEKGIRFVRIAPLSWDGVQGSTPVDRGLETFLAVCADPKNHPILVHCYRGVHRTGAYCAVYRMECDGWSKGRALDEMVTAGYAELDVHDDIRGYLMSYRAGGKYRLDDRAVGRRSRLLDPQPR